MQSSPIRQLCSSTLLQFLLDYPVGQKRFQQHMHKVIANLSYEHEAGRLAAIDMLSVLISKLPKELLATYAPVLFLPLVTRLVNDTSARCRQDIGSAIMTLMKVGEIHQMTALVSCPGENETANTSMPPLAAHCACHTCWHLLA